MKTYIGMLGYDGQRTILVRQVREGSSRIYELPHVERHSPTGFEWGYGGSGPADAALSILQDALGAESADALYQKFKWAVVSKFSRGLTLGAEEWELPETQIEEWLETVQSKATA